MKNFNSYFIKLFYISVVLTLTFSYTVRAQQLSSTPLPGEKPGWPLEQGHLDQFFLDQYSFETLYKMGGKLFRAEFNRLDGVGANLAEDAEITKRFTRHPNVNLPGYLSPTVKRPSGPEAQNCLGCHILQRTTGTGAVYNVARDAFIDGDINNYLNRKSTHLWGSGALQILAEQTTKELHKLRDAGLKKAEITGKSVEIELINSNNVNYGLLTAFPDGTTDTSQIIGLNGDLVVRPYHKKGIVPFLRLQSVVANHSSVGMQGPEVMLDPNIDEDNDGVLNEFTVGDHTALILYVAGLPRPVTKLELHKNLGGEHSLTKKQIRKIKRGERLFSKVGCGGCHTPAHVVKDPTFSEPSQSIFYRFDSNTFPFFGGGDPIAFGLDYRKPTTFDITNNPGIKCEENRDRRKNDKRHHRFKSDKHKKSKCWRQFERGKNGSVIIRNYGDQRYHNMGPLLAAEVDEFGTGASTWRTNELWGVADTGPWLHDGRATTLPEAIWWHGGSAQEVRDKYFDLPGKKQEAIVAFLENLVIYAP